MAKSIVVKDLVKKFGAFVSVDHISFDVEEGEIFGFLGANGAGKSTTIRMLCGLMAPTSGFASVAGFDCMKQPERVKANIGYMAQKFALYGDLTVDENIMFYGGMYDMPRAQIEKRREEVIGLLELADKRSELAGTLPRGYQQRLSFACAMLHNPKVIFLDEPTGGVDPLQRRNFWNLIYDMSARGVTVFVTTHFLDEAEFCGRITLLVAGKIVACDSPTNFKKRLSSDGIFEIECDKPVAALEIASKLDFVKQASIFGGSIHVTARRGAEAEAALLKTLADNGVLNARLSRIEPSLEDVFLSLVEER